MNEINLSLTVFKLIKDRRDLILNTLEFNNVKNMEHYREIMGELTSLGYIETEIKNLLEKNEQEEI